MPVDLLGQTAQTPQAVSRANVRRDTISPHVRRREQTGIARPRLLSFVGRWGRARRWLPPEARRIVDVGCAFGYGTVALAAHGRSRRWIVGVERDVEHLRHAGQSYPWLPLVRADASVLPFRDGSLDASVLLDVLEHTGDPGEVLGEQYRVLRGGGCVVFSVPHQGLLAAFDALNVYPALRRRWRSWPPLAAADESATGTHRHFSIAEARAILGAHFAVDRIARTGLGLFELLNLALLVVFNALLRWRGAYQALRVFPFAAYLVDDLVPAGALGYYLTVRARAQ